MRRRHGEMRRASGRRHGVAGLLLAGVLLVACGGPPGAGSDDRAVRELQAEWSNGLAVLYASGYSRADLEADEPPAGHDAGQRAAWARCRALYLRAVQVHPLLSARGLVGPEVVWPLP